MKLYMASVNYQNSCMEDRERLSFSSEQVESLCKSIYDKEKISGCVILATCNRTEIYVSSNDDDVEIRPDYFLLSHSDVNDFDGVFERKCDRDVVCHLIELASGLKSQILGEGQIVTQINTAWKIAADAGCTDSYLNVLFRNAVTAGKYVLTHAHMSAVPLSSAYGAYDLLKRKFTKLKGKRGIIIGNGNMGKLMQGLLIEQGCDVKVTIRGYVHGNNEVMAGCHKIKYADRYKHIENCDFVVSATKSPHFTITYNEMSRLKSFPQIMIDLAMPRDIEEKAGELCEVKNINELGFKTEVDEETLNRVYDIIEKYINRFYEWYTYKQSLEEIEKMRAVMKKRIMINCQMELSHNLDINTEKIIDISVDKAVNMMLGGMKGTYTYEEIKQCREKIEKRARI